MYDPFLFTEFSMAPVMISFLLGLSRLFMVVLAFYIPFSILVRVFSFRNILRS